MASIVLGNLGAASETLPEQARVVIEFEDIFAKDGRTRVDWLELSYEEETNTFVIREAYYP